MILKDFQNLLNINHHRLRDILNEFTQNELLIEETDNLLDKKNRLMRNIKTYQINQDIIHSLNFRRFLTLSNRYLEINTFLEEISKFDFTSRIPYKSNTTINEKKILDYLNMHPNFYLSSLDIKDYVKVTSISEVRRCLIRLKKLGYVDSKRGYQINIKKKRNRSYKDTFYKLIPSNSVNDSSFVKITESNDLERVYSPFPFSLQEIIVILFLKKHRLDSKNSAISITDLSDNLRINMSTLNILVKRLNSIKVKRNWFTTIKIHESWSISKRKQISKFSRSPFVYLNRHIYRKRDFIKFLNDIETFFPNLTKHLKLGIIPLKYPLALNEIKVLNTIFKLRNLGVMATPSEVETHLILNENNKSNKAMINKILSKLESKEFLRKRTGKKIKPFLVRKKIKLGNSRISFFEIKSKYSKNKELVKFFQSILD